MKFVFSVMVLQLFFSWGAWSQSLSADQVIQKQMDASAGFQAEQSQGEMILISAKGNQVRRVFEYAVLEKKDDVGAKSLIKLTWPADLKGVGLLSHQNQNRDNDQWFYMPALKKTKRIAGDSRKSRFIGSDFTFEDLSAKNKNDFIYKMLPEEPCGSRQCYVIESQPKPYYKTAYSKSVSWISKDDYLQRRVDLYDKKYQLKKRLVLENYKKLNQKYWRPMIVVMKDLVKNRETKMIFSEILLGTGLTASDFSRAALER